MKSNFMNFFIICLSLVLSTTVFAAAATVKTCDLHSMLPLITEGFKNYVVKTMREQAIPVNPEKISIRYLGKDSIQDDKQSKPIVQNIFSLQVPTEVDGIVLSVVTPMHALNAKNTGFELIVPKTDMLAFPDPEIWVDRDRFGRIRRRICDVKTHAGFNRYIAFVNRTENNFIVYSDMISATNYSLASAEMPLKPEDTQPNPEPGEEPTPEPGNPSP